MQKSQIVRWTINEKEQVIKVNLGTLENPQNVKINKMLEFKRFQALTTLLSSSRTYLPRSTKI